MFYTILFLFNQYIYISMKTFKDYIYENKLFEEQCDKYLIDINSNNNEYYEIDESVIDWFKNLFKKTGSFLEKWVKRGGKKIQASENSGTFKITNEKTSKLSINSINDKFKSESIYSKIFVNTYNYLKNYRDYVIKGRNSNYFNNDIKMRIIYFIPKYAFEDEKYPVSIILYSDTIKVKEDNENGIHIFNFDMSNIITGVTESQMFKIFIENIEKTKNKKLSYITYSVKDTTIPPEIKKISYDGKKFKEHAEKYAMMTLIENK